MTGPKRGVVVLRGNDSGGFYSAKWTGGAWSTLTREGAAVENFISSPAPASGKVLVAHQSGASTTAIRLGVFDDARGTWSTLGQNTNALGNNFGTPSIAARADGSAMVVFAGGATSNHRFTTNAGGSWLASPLEIPGSATPLDTPSVELARRSGSDQLVAVMRSGNGTSLRWSAWSGAAWSSATELATDLKANAFSPFATTSLPDGRIVLAYSDAAGQVRAGFFDGATWSTLKIVPLSPAANRNAGRTVAIAQQEGTGTLRIRGRRHSAVRGQGSRVRRGATARRKPSRPEERRRVAPRRSSLRVLRRRSALHLHRARRADGRGARKPRFGNATAFSVGPEIGIQFGF